MAIVLLYGGAFQKVRVSFVQRGLPLFELKTKQTRWSTTDVLIDFRREKDFLWQLITLIISRV